MSLTPLKMPPKVDSLTLAWEKTVLGSEPPACQAGVVVQNADCAKAAEWVGDKSCGCQFLLCHEHYDLATSWEALTADLVHLERRCGFCHEPMPEQTRWRRL